MKRINLFAGVLFVLVGFCAGVGFSLFSTKIEAQGRPEPPPTALKSVAHDATLIGDGTTFAPLGLANSAVTAPKLSAVAVPSVGQVLGFNGANLAWQDAPVGGGVRVVDSLGQVVGPFVANGGSILRMINNKTFVLSINKNGFVSNQQHSLRLFFLTSDCTGPSYLPVVQTNLVLDPNSQHESAQFGTQLLYPAEPTQQVTLVSARFLQGDPPELGRCDPIQPGPSSAGLLITLDLSTLGLIPPFHLEF